MKTVKSIKYLCLLGFLLTLQFVANSALASAAPAAADSSKQDPEDHSDSEDDSASIPRRNTRATLRNRGGQDSSAPQEHRANQNIFIAKLGPNTQEMRRPSKGDQTKDGKTKGVRVCVYRLRADEKEKKQKLIDHINEGSRHPGVTRGLLATQHRDDRISIEVEICDSGSLERAIPKLRPEHYAQVAEGVASQISSVLFHYQMVHSLPHRRVAPDEILLRPDGCVKLTPFDTLTKSEVLLTRANFCLDSPLTSPERRDLVDRFFSEIHQEHGDVWGLGMTALATTLAKPLVRPTKPFIGESEEAFNLRVTRYEIDRREVNNLVRNNTWQPLVSDLKLRYFIQRCLETDHTKRAGLAEIAALPYLFKYIQPIDNDDPQNNIALSDTKIREVLTKLPNAREELLTTDVTAPSFIDRSNFALYQQPILALAVSCLFQSAWAYWGSSSHNLTLTPQGHEAVKQIAELLTQENEKWKRVRSDKSKRSEIDDFMHEIIKKRQEKAREKIRTVPEIHPVKKAVPNHQNGDDDSPH